MRVRHHPRCAIFNDPPSLRMDSDCNCGAISPLPTAASISLEQAITTLVQRKHNLPYDAETIVRADEIDHALDLLRTVRV